MIPSSKQRMKTHQNRRRRQRQICLCSYFPATNYFHLWIDLLILMSRLAALVIVCIGVTLYQATILAFWVRPGPTTNRSFNSHNGYQTTPQRSIPTCTALHLTHCTTLALQLAISSAWCAKQRPRVAIPLSLETSCHDYKNAAQSFMDRLLAAHNITKGTNPWLVTLSRVTTTLRISSSCCHSL